jgi:hypothetical protein
MTVDHARPSGRIRWWAVLRRKDVLSGLLFAGVAAYGLWVSQNYPVGTASRMGTGYMPRLLLWVLLGLGGWILVSGLLKGDRIPHPVVSVGPAWRPLVLVTQSRGVFGRGRDRRGGARSIQLQTGHALAR